MSNAKIELANLFSGLKTFTMLLARERGEPHYRELIEVHFSDELSNAESVYAAHMNSKKEIK